MTELQCELVYRWLETDKFSVYLAFRYGSETKYSFKKKSEVPGTESGFINLASKTALETYKSSVFRNGDWNVAGPHFVRHSVTCNDFHIKPFTDEETKGVKEQEDNGELKQSDAEKTLDPKGN